MNPFLPTPAKLELVHPVDGPTGAFLTLVGLESSQARAAVKAANLEAKSMLDISDENAKVIVACIVGWDDKFAEHFGLYTPERAKEVFLAPEALWMLEQAGTFMKERKNFFRRAG